MSTRPTNCVAVLAVLLAACSPLAAEPLPEGALAHLRPSGPNYPAPQAAVTVTPEGQVLEGKAVSPDGKLVATFSDEHVVRLLGAESGQELRRLEGHTAYLATVA